MMVQQISSFSRDVDNAQWVQSLSLKDGKLVRVIIALESLVPFVDTLLILFLQDGLLNQTSSFAAKYDRYREALSNLGKALTNFEGNS